MKKLIDTVIIEKLSKFHLEKVMQIDNEDFTGVKREVKKLFAKQGKKVTEKFLNEGVLALKQYYLVPVIDPKNMHAISDSADPFWHAHIIHTKQYTKFCEDVFGEYIHHEPLDHAINQDVDDVRDLYHYTADMMNDYFTYVNKDFYPSKMPDLRLICYHYRIINPKIYNKGLIPINQKLKDIATRQERKSA